MNTVKDIVVFRKEIVKGEEKSFSQNIGILITKPDGKTSIKLNTVPVGWDGWASVFDKKPKGSKGAPDEISEIEPF
jgi:hypothetical protein